MISGEIEVCVNSFNITGKTWVRRQMVYNCFLVENKEFYLVTALTATDLYFFFLKFMQLHHDYIISACQISKFNITRTY